MLSNHTELTLGMEVYSADGTDLGTIKRLWRPDGSIEPPETSAEIGRMAIRPESRAATAGYMLIARPLAPDWYVPYSAIRDVQSDRVVLALTAEEARRLPWQEPPA